MDWSGREVAVLTGDVVRSTSLASEDRARLSDLLRQAAAFVQEDDPDLAPLPLAIFRGDAWQWLVVDRAQALRAAVLFRCSFRGQEPDLKLDTRVAIGVGTIDFLNEERLSESDGSAFRMSGYVLEKLPKKRCLGVDWAEGSVPDKTDLRRRIVSLVDLLVSDLTARQARGLSGYLRGWTQQRVGELWDPPITQQSVADLFEDAWLYDFLEALKTGI